jgi:hypothetical protein
MPETLGKCRPDGIRTDKRFRFDRQESDHQTYVESGLPGTFECAEREPDAAALAQAGKSWQKTYSVVSVPSGVILKTVPMVL